MMTDTNQDTESQAEGGVEQRLDDLEGSLIDQLQDDGRLASSVPGGPQTDDLDFIQMSGLTRPVSSERATGQDAPRQSEGMDPSVPVSFYEEGVADVDDSMDPVSLEDAPVPAEEPVVSAPEPEAISAARSGKDSDASLEAIIADLSRDEPVVDAVSEAAAPTSAAAPVAPATPPGASESPLADDADVPERDADDAGGDDASGAGELSLRSKASEPTSSDPSAQEGRPALSGAASSARGLAEAESLLQELEEQERHVPPVEPLIADKPSLEPTGGPSAATDFENEDDESDLDKSVYRRPHSTESRRRKRGRGSTRRRLTRWTFRLALVVVVAVGGFQGVTFIMTRTATQDEIFSMGVKLLGQEKYRDASKAFRRVVSVGDPLSPRSAEAEFMAAYALQLVPEIPRVAAKAAYEESLLLFQGFIATNPAHRKAARAETLIGLLFYKMQRYDEAIGILRNPRRRLGDPGAYLPSLRALGHSYFKRGEIDKARSVFLEAASLKENLMPDEDYLQLAALYEMLARREGSEDRQRHFQQAAIDQWNSALRVPGLPSARKRAIGILRDVMIEELEGSTFLQAPQETRMPGAPGTPQTTTTEAEHIPAGTELEPR